MPAMSRTFAPSARVAAVMLACLLGPASARAVEQPLEPGEVGITAPSRLTYSLDAVPKVNRLDFDFHAGESTAWILDNGDFHFHGWIPHSGLLCATYRVGLRFGEGAPGCLNVKWITEPIFVTSQYQCNGARMEHDGGDTVPEVGALVTRITCAERVVRCSGSCR